MSRPYHQHYIRVLILMTLSVLLLGCVSKTRVHQAPDTQEYLNAKIKGYQNIRSWGDEIAPYTYTNSNLKSIKTNKKIHKRVDVLALSGGAEDGAYGAGFLKGWSDRGNRPVFTVVTGISTGALIAPFAFLGSKYDPEIKRLYTETSKKNIFAVSLSKIFFGASITDTQPLRKILAEEIDDNFVAELAREAKKGRILHIGTTNLDAQRPMVWEITKIAQSGRPDAKKLIQDIMLASASIPGAFPPVLIDVMIDGKKHQELHVDGGVTRQIFVYHRDLNIRKLENLLNIRSKKNMWLIRNTKISPEYTPVELSLSSIAGRSVSTLIKYQGRGDLVNIMSLAKRDGFRLHMTDVPKEFDVPLKDLFDRDYMRALYKVGYEKGNSKNAWHTAVKF